MNFFSKRSKRIMATAVGCSLPLAVSAQAIGKITAGLTAAGGTVYGQGPDIPTIVANLISIALTFVGVLLLCYLLYAGFLWMTAGGDSKKTTEAKEIIKNAIIGLIIVFSAYAIASYVLSKLVGITTNSSNQPG